MNEKSEDNKTHCGANGRRFKKAMEGLTLVHRQIRT